MEKLVLSKPGLKSSGEINCPQTFKKLHKKRAESARVDKNLNDKQRKRKEEMRIFKMMGEEQKFLFTNLSKKNQSQNNFSHPLGMARMKAMSINKAAANGGTSSQYEK